MIGADAIRGHIDLILLAILEAGPSYAYEISKTLTDRSRGEYVIKQTTLYSAVKRLQAQGLLDSYEDLSPTGKPRTYYSSPRTASTSSPQAHRMAQHPSTRGSLRGRKGRLVNVIDSYLDTLFAPYPDSPRLREARAELRTMMEDSRTD